MARAGRLLLALVPCALVGCEDELTDPTWFAAPDTVVLYSLARPELDLVSAFNFDQRATVPIERPGAATQWDVALDTRGGQLVLLGPAAFGIPSRVRLAALTGQTFDNVVEAPEDTLLYTATGPVPLQLNSTYVVRTDSRSQSIGGGCSHYAKLSPLAIDVAAGRLRFVYDSSPFCNDRRLVPPDTT